jgi:hypothetical protein
VKQEKYRSKLSAGERSGARFAHSRLAAARLDRIFPIELAREIEVRGVSTVGLALVKEVAMAAHAPRSGLVIQLPYRWRPQADPPVFDWNTPSQVLVSALAGMKEVA